MSKRGDNIHKRKDGRWEGRYKKELRANGTWLYGSVYGNNYREVKEKLSKNQISPSKNNQTKVEEKTFSEILALWMNNNRIRLKGGTINKYQSIIDSQITDELGSVKMSNLTSVMINSFLHKKLIDGRRDGKGALSATYVRSIMLIIKAAINYAVCEQYCQPLKSAILKPASEKIFELSILSFNEQQQLETFVLNNITPTNVGVFVSLYTGLRIGEVCALRWEDIDFKEKILKVRHTVARVASTNKSTKKTQLILDTPKTKSSNRDIPIPSILMPLLKTLYEDSSSSYVVSSCENFISPRTYEYRYHRLLKTCGIVDTNYHALRHTFATRCIESGVDVKSLSEMLGHSNVSITLNTYVHSSMELKRKQLEKICYMSH